MILPYPNEMEMEQHSNKTGLVVSNQQILLPSTSNRDTNGLNDFTHIKPDPDEMEYNENKTSQGASNQQIPLPCPLKYEVKEEMMYCQFCPHSDVDFGKLKFHTFTQHPTGAAVVRFGESDHDIKFFCVKATCDFSTTMSTIYEEHLMNCCPLHENFSRKEKERLKSTLQFVLDFHSKHCLSDNSVLLEYYTSFNTTYTSEDDLLQVRKHMEHNDLFSDVPRSSSLSDVQSSMVCEDVGNKLEGPFSSVPNPVPVFIVQNQNRNHVGRRANVSENIISKSFRKQNKNNEQLLMTGPSELKISTFQVHTPSMETQKQKKSFPCVNCDKCFRYRRDLIIHMRTHSGEKPFRCDVCDRVFTYSSHLSIHKRRHTGEKPFKCDVCDKQFFRSSDVIVHKRTHTGERPFQCEICAKEFTRSCHLTVHKRIHTGEKPFKCDSCDKVFARSADLTVHKRTHTGEKPYKCDVCDKKFNYSSQVNVHKRTHTGEKPFKCNMCEKDFADSSTLIQHKRTHTGEKPFKCNVCDKEYTKSGDLNIHKRIHTGEKPFKCNECDKDYVDSSALSKHKKRHKGKNHFNVHYKV